MAFKTVAKDAWAFYMGLAEDQRQAVLRFFDEMDADRSRSISISEFFDFLEGEGYQSANYYWLFDELDGDGNGTLDFKELVTFFYMLHRKEFRELINAPARAEAPRGQRRPGDQGRRRNRDRLLELLNIIVNAFQCGLSVAHLVVE